MLQPKLPAEEREAIETTIQDKYDLSAYVTAIGGLGAYPTIVVDQAPLDWVLSTVAHEWIHNYLTMFPLGVSYTDSAELTILNETVAEIAGDELGAQVLARPATRRWYTNSPARTSRRRPRAGATMTRSIFAKRCATHVKWSTFS